jgi:hypothetical protein
MVIIIDFFQIEWLTAFLLTFRRYVELLCCAGDKNPMRVRIMERSTIVLVRNARVFVAGTAGATFAQAPTYFRSLNYELF